MFRFLNKKEYLRCFKSKFLHDHLTLPIQSFRYRSHYTSLGLDSSASQKDIKSAYYKLSLKFHPDKNDGSPESVEKFRQIAEAYEVLGNPEKKRIYDRDFSSGTDYSGDFQRERQHTRQGYYYRPSTRTGRDQYYNYEEHIRQHYEKFYRERQAEQEHMRRRWEADNRYRDANHWSTYRQPPRPPGMTAKEFFASKTFRYLSAFWILMILMSLFTDADQPKQNKPIYYNAEKNKPKKPIYYDVTKDVKAE